MAVADRFYTPGVDTSNDGIEVDYVEHVLPFDGIKVHVYEWLPEGTPRAVVHISHGAGEHARRYQRLANALRASGFAVVADDHLGHGRTGVYHRGIGEMGKHGMRDSLRLIRHVITWTRGRYAGARLVELAHSWGSLMAQKQFADEPDIFDALVLSGTTVMLPGIANTGDFNAPYGDDGHGMSWLSRDKAEVQKMIDDLYGFDIGQSDMLDLPGLLGTFSLPPLRRRGRAARVPVLILAGEHDAVSLGRARGARSLAWAYRNVTKLDDVTLRVSTAAASPLTTLEGFARPTAIARAAATVRGATALSCAGSSRSR
ncbi:alpha/beta hydrolase [Gulosibacter sp. ACHW.36C]|uniref:Alpha/beta hydrolase n=1 Tax=Gulosibacter sediminis TaxID=1729695 RepID=A0ABY4MZ35_9MICO|nr:alpha/beta hydrolase [Gulosibacter sediminis]UQN14651.1 alpha/beta hydrolase [Gulosibacter sediminis]